MSNSKGASSIRNTNHNGTKHPLLPPKSPFPSFTPSYLDYTPNLPIGPKSIPKSREQNPHHLRTCSSSVLIEDQPSWLDDLLNEPESPVQRRSHRRSSSDSFAYIEATDANNLDHYKDTWSSSYYGTTGSFGTPKNRVWDSPLNLLPKKINGIQRPVALHAAQEGDGVSNTVNGKQDLNEYDAKASFERNESSYTMVSASETDTKRAKQQFAQRSRVRKLQYIAELERNVQTLQAEGSEVSAQLEFINQQNLILSMENKALKQRLDSLAKEQLIKYLEHEVLEREIGRLRSLYQQQQQQQPPPSSSHRRSSSRDLDSQFANLSLKHTGPSHGGPISGPLHI